MAQSELDELFGEGAGQPEPRVTLVWVLLVSGLIFTLLGLACTSAPGGLLVLGAWVVIEKEVDRVDSGYLPLSDRPRLVRLQNGVKAGLILVIIAFVLQGALFCNGFYEVLWASMLQWLFTGEVTVPQ